MEGIKMSYLTRLKKKFETFSSYTVGEHRSIAEANYDRRNLSSHLKDADPLTKSEKEEIKALWGGIIKSIPRGYEFYRGLKALNGFKASYLPSSFFFPYIEGVLNPPEWKYQLAHKSMLQLAYRTHIQNPTTVLRTYGGILFDNDYKPILRSQVRNILLHYDQPLLLKPAVDTEQGAGITLIQQKDFITFAREIESGRIFESYREFLVQVPVKQCAQTALFNSTSLNCMRVTTINLNGEISVGSRALKCGSKDSVVDNIGTGRRGVMVGIDANGKLKDKGFYGNGEFANEHNGIIFDGYVIDHFHKVEEAAKTLHTLVPACKIIGWDIALNENNEPVLIEGNTVYPGISLEQMCSGPIFGDRAEEVIEYISDVIKKTF